MPVSVTNANLVVKDKNGNTGVVKTLTTADVTKIKNAISDVAVVVDPTTHAAIPATTSRTGVVQLADAAAISAGTPGRVVDAAQLQAVSSAISVNSTYTEPAARTGIISSASDLLTAPGGSTPVTKDYVDLTSAQTVGGVKTFTALPRASTVPTADDQLVNKAYADTKVSVLSTLYVDGSSGSDTNDGKTAATAFKTIGKATTAVHSYRSSRNDGMIAIQIAGGTYAEAVAVSGPVFVQLRLVGNVTVNSLSCTHTCYCNVIATGEYTFTASGKISVGQNSMLTLSGADLTHVYAAGISVDDNSEIRVDTTPVTVNCSSGSACSVYRSRALFTGPVEFIHNSSSTAIAVTVGSALHFNQAVSLSGSCAIGISVTAGSLLDCVNSSSTYLDYTATTTGNALVVSDNSAAIFNGSGTYALHVHAAVSGAVISCVNHSSITKTTGNAPIVIENTATGRTAQDITIGASSGLNINALSLTTATTSNCLNVYLGSSAYVTGLTINNSSSSAATSVYVAMSSSLEIGGSVSMTRANTATSEGFLTATLKSSLYMSGYSNVNFTVNGGCNAVVVVDTGAFVGFRRSGAYTVSGTVASGMAYRVGALSLFNMRGHTMPSASGTTPYVDTAHFGAAV